MSSTRSERGKGVKLLVQSNTKVPGNWQSFLRNDGNKIELLGYLAEELITIDSKHTKHMLSTKRQTVICSSQMDEMSGRSPCSLRS